MVAYESKISSYSASGRYTLYHVYSFTYCVECLAYVQLVSYKRILQCIYCYLLSCGSALFFYHWLLRIIRHHQSQIQTNRNAIDIDKYKKSVFTICYILANFLLSYVPFACTLAAFNIMGFLSTKLARDSVNACAVIVFSSSFVNPLLYYWRIKEIRDSVKRILRNVCREETEEES